MGKQISNSSILLTSAIPLDARSHFITYKDAMEAVADRDDMSVVRSSINASVTSGIYQNYYYGQIITTEQHGTFTVVQQSNYSEIGAALEDDWKEHVTYFYNNSTLRFIISTTAGTYVKAGKYSWPVTTESEAVLTTEVANLYSLYDLPGPFLKITLKNITDLVPESDVQFINSDLLSPHLQPFNGSGGGGGGGSNLSGAITTDGTLLNIVNNRIQVGNLAALDKITTNQLDDTLLNIANRKMNETQFELNDNIYSLKWVYCGTSADTE